MPASEQQGQLSTNNLLNQNVDYAATLALMSLVMCVKETKGKVPTISSGNYSCKDKEKQIISFVAITQRLEEAMAASIGNLTKELNGNH